MSESPGASFHGRGADFIAEVGGGVDETRVALRIYGLHLDPNEISKLLGCPPTQSHFRGDKSRRGPPTAEGAWVLALKGEAPVTPNELLARLLNILPSDPVLWQAMTTKYRIDVSFGLFVTAWVRGFELEPALIARLATMGVPVGFSIYSEREDD